MSLVSGATQGCKLLFGGRQEAAVKSVAADDLQAIEYARPQTDASVLSPLLLKETFVKVSPDRAKVLVADYDLIRADFPQISNLSDADIDVWLVDNVAYVSAPQASQEVVNDQVPTVNRSRWGYRPPEYRRASVMPVFDPALAAVRADIESKLYTRQSPFELTAAYLGLDFIAIMNHPALSLSELKEQASESKMKISDLARAGAFNYVPGSSKKARNLLSVIDFIELATEMNGKESSAVETEVSSLVAGVNAAVDAAVREADGKSELSRGQIGLMDLKGTGSLHPLQEGHQNGLATTGELLREFLFEKLVSAVLASEQEALRSGARKLEEENSGVGDISTFKENRWAGAFKDESGQQPRRAVGNYAVIDLGFSVRAATGELQPAGILVRQSTARKKNFLSNLDSDVSVSVERMLRRYALSSAGAHYGVENVPVNFINIQGTESDDLIDFGAYIHDTDFLQVATTNNVKRPKRVGKEDVRAAEEVMVPEAQWGMIEGAKGKDPVFDKPWVWSHKTAQAFREENGNRDAVRSHARNMLEPAFRRLKIRGFEGEQRFR